MLNKKRILIIRLSSIGDVLHATPVASALKAAAPDCHITWIVSRTAAKLLENNPHIDHVMIWSREDFEAAAANRELGQLKKLWQQLQSFYQREKFDIALDIHGLFLTGAILLASRTPRRIGMADARELNRFFMTEQAAPAAHAHVIERYLSVLRPLHIDATDHRMTLRPTPAEERFAVDFLLRHAIDRNKKILFVNPVTSWHSKNWSIAQFAKCMDLLHADIEIVLCGANADRPAIESIRTLTDRRLISATGQTSLTELAALLAQGDLLLTGDTGALHIAVAMGTPTISLWGPTQPEQYGPLAPGHTVIRSPFSCTGCHKTTCRYKTYACMQSIAPEAVAQEINTQFFGKDARQ